MIDRAWIGRDLGERPVVVEAGRLRFFAKAIGETNPVYLDEGPARRVSTLLAPPTFLFQPDVTLEALALLGVLLGKVLHGEQRFEYQRPAREGEHLRVRSSIKNIYDKKNGALEFVEVESVVTDRAGETVCRMTSTAVVRN